MKNSELVIDIHGLTKNFDDVCVVDHISLQVPKGCVYGFLGPNGSGKTTTLRMICGLLTPTSGSGTCLGYNILTQSELIKSNVGYMTQQFSLYDDLSVYENLDFIARIYQMPDRKQRVQESLDSLGIDHRRQAQLTGELSGGWKQRLALAAAILHKPKLLLLDEPTAGVDPKARREFWDEIHKLVSNGMTTLVTTHYMDEAERCHLLAYISNGRLLATGTNDEIIAQTHLATWEVSGPDLYLLAEKLRAQTTELQVTLFGSLLHVSSHNKSLLEKTIAPWKKPPYHWRAVDPNLEDVFIYLMQTKHPVEVQ